MLLHNGIAIAPTRIDLLQAGNGGNGGGDAPTSLTATRDGGYTRINLAWTDNAGGTAVYRIYRSTDNVNFSQIDTTAAGAEFYQDSGLTRGQTYYYYVTAFEDSTESDPSNTDSATVFDISDVTLYAEYDADEDVYNDAGSTLATDGQTVQEIHDQSGNGRHITQATASARPTLQTGEVNGHNVIRHASGDVLKAATPSDWAFLHDGTEFAVYVVWKVPNINATMAVLDTGALSAADTGFAIYMASTNLINAKIAKGVGGDYEVECITATEAVADDTWHVSAARLTASELEFNNDGYWGGDDYEAPDDSPSASDPTSALTVGGRRDNSFNLIGDWARILIVSGTVSDADHEAVQDYLSEEYDTSTHKYFGAASVVQHDTSGLDHNAFPGICIAPNGDLVIAYRKGSSHASGDGEIVVQTSSDLGDTWSGEVTVLSDASWDYRSASLTTLSNGTIMMAVGRRTSAGSNVTNGITVITSSDNGANWSGETVVSHSMTASAREGGAVLELANGDLLYPFYGQNSGDGSTWRCAVSKSTDDGDTWSQLSQITQGHLFAEPGIELLAGGDIVALIRDNNAEAIRYATSEDSGETWSSITYAAKGNGRCNPLVLDTGEIIDFQRHAGSGNQPHLLTSLDGGVSWQFGTLFDVSPNFTFGNSVYGQAAQGEDGTVYVLYGIETTGGSSSTTSDIMFAKTE